MSLSVLTTSPCGRYVAKDSGHKAEPLQVWSVDGAEPLCIIPKYQSSFFGNQAFLLFCPLGDELRIVGCSSPSQLGVYNLQGELLHSSAQLNDYIVGMQAVQGGKQIFVESIIWHPIYCAHLLDVQQLLTTPEYGGLRIWQDDEEVDCSATDTHFTAGRDQSYTWEQVLKLKSISYQEQSVQYQEYSAWLKEDRIEFRCQVDGVVDKEDQTEDLGLIGSIPRVVGEEESYRLVIAFRPAAGLGEMPTVLALRTPDRVGMWTLKGELLAESGPLTVDEEIKELEVDSSGEYAWVRWRPEVLLKLSNLLHQSDYRGKVVRQPEVGGYPIHTSKDVVQIGGTQLTLAEAYEIPDLAVHSQNLKATHYPTTFPAQLCKALSNGSLQASERFQLHFTPEQPEPDRNINARYQGCFPVESESTRPDPTCTDEATLRALALPAASSEQTMRCFGSGSRIVMPHFLDAFANAQVSLEDLPLAVYTAFFKAPPSQTLTDWLDMSVVVGKLLLRFRMRQQPAPNPENQAYSQQWSVYDPTALLELYVSRVQAVEPVVAV